MRRGYIKLWRKTLDSGLLQNGPAWQLFGYLLLQAAYKPQRQLVGSSVYELEPGQLIFSRTKAAADLKLGEQQVRTALALLRKLDVITGRTTNQCTVITVVNWHNYQADAPGANQRDEARPVEELPAEPSDETTFGENAKNQPATNQRDNQPPNQPGNRQNGSKTYDNPDGWENDPVPANQPPTGQATGGPRQIQPTTNQRLTGGPSASDQIKELKNIKNINLRTASGGADAARTLPPSGGEDAESASEDGAGGVRTLEVPARVPAGKGGASAEVYRTKKGRKLTGKRLASFERLWRIFAYPRGKAEAADAWLDIPALTDALVERICAAARQEAEGRAELVARGHTPKMAQGWISGRRWEDYDPPPQPERAEEGERPLRALYDDGRPVEGPPTPEEIAANQERMRAMRRKLQAQGLIGRGEAEPSPGKARTA